MRQRSAYAALLLVTTGMVAPAALAQVAPSTGAPSSSAPAGPPSTSTMATGVDPSNPQATPAADGQAAGEQQAAEVSAPGVDTGSGDDIVVVGRNIPNTVRSTAQVINVLSAADIARTGEGDIAGALTRVTGLSVVGNGYVFVRGLGDRYSSALLNGSPLPSPEPLRRTVPLDIFPTSIVGSALVQKTYSVNYPGEFGGGVINLTTKALPDENFVTIGASGALDTQTTAKLGYTYYGSKTDWLGYDSGERDVPDFIRAAPNGTGVIPAAQVAQLSNARTTLLQRNTDIPANWSGDINIGLVGELGAGRIGMIATGSVANTWRTRATTQQDTVSADGSLRNDFSTVITDNRAVVNGLLGFGYEFDENRIRWTNVYIHDTLKQGRASAATVYNNSSGNPIFQQNTNWFERQLIESQLVGEFKPIDDLSIDVRGAYANSKRNSPYERQFIYTCNTNLNVRVNDPVAGEGVACPGVWQATNAFDRFATVVFSELKEDLYSGQADVTYKLSTERPFTLSGGYYYSQNERSSIRLPFTFQTATGGAIPFPCNLFRPDYLLSPDVLSGCPVATTGTPADNAVQLRFDSGLNGSFAYDASLKIHAGYVQAEAEAIDGIRAIFGVRYETAKQSVTPIGALSTRLNNDYWLPAATLTWNFAPDMQLRLAAAKTIARPQFRELAPQAFRDFESDRLFFGNPNLRDSELYNLEARYEWFFDRDQRLTAAGFYKRIDRPIEQVGFYPTPDARLQTGFTYLPKATLYGGEIEVQKYLPLDFISDEMAGKRLVFVGNYTYTQSQITANASCVPSVLGVTLGGCPAGFAPANLQFRDGAPLTGQSDHLVNVQLGYEDKENATQATLLFNYASERVTNRGPSLLTGVGFQPDIIEKPGIRVDFVARQTVDFLGTRVELKGEARNLTGTKYQERQTFDDGRQVFINRFEQGRLYTLGASITF
ncbi:TonB-dependent receptor plug domain-containing protein [Sphingomonas sp. NBWT7]|uniref:TonB-dependent receptor domain-containing protein n=1 Tax=Sphingomonas sp. NBWT7 TaxID=2596913 RepID=UPI00162A2F31|nr:TonB-dependent receptor [Sphingomonas sp. NBWT7]QNE30726.1 TonB-dependent receptor plug domain-containing protein [Sphingomonas sp. NBWT7]